MWVDNSSMATLQTYVLPVARFYCSPSSCFPVNAPGNVSDLYRVLRRGAGVFSAESQGACGGRHCSAGVPRGHRRLPGSPRCVPSSTPAMPVAKRKKGVEGVGRLLLNDGSCVVLLCGLRCKTCRSTTLFWVSLSGLVSAAAFPLLVLLQSDWQQQCCNEIRVGDWSPWWPPFVRTRARRQRHPRFCAPPVIVAQTRLRRACGTRESPRSCFRTSRRH